MSNRDWDNRSRKHVLDLVSSSDFESRANSLLKEHKWCIANPSERQPLGRGDPAACKEVSVESYLRSHDKWRFGPKPLHGWWASHGGKRPTWDLICQIEANRGGDLGLLLVEAKAYRSERKWNGKKEPDQSNSKRIENHAAIANSIAGANRAFSRLGFGGFGLSISTKYQLANRLAYLWKLTELGVPTVLMYLGFIGDTSIRSGYFQDDEDWRRAMAEYLDGTVPFDFVNHPFQSNEGTQGMFTISSLPVTTNFAPGR